MRFPRVFPAESSWPGARHPTDPPATAEGWRHRGPV